MTRNPFIEAIEAAGGTVMVNSHKGRRPGIETIESARAKAIEQVRSNKDWYQMGLGLKPNLIYKQVGPRYQVGIKYSNRYLTGWCEDSFDNYDEVLPEHMMQTFDACIWDIENGNCDAALQEVMQANLELRRRGRKAA